MAIVLNQSSRVGSGTFAAATTFYFNAGCCTVATSNATEANRQPIIRTEGFTSKMYIIVTSNDLITASTLRYRKNSANGNQNVSIPAATTGTFQDAANFDSLLVADLVGYQLITGGAGTTFLFSNVGQIFSSSVNTSQRLVHQLGADMGSLDPYPFSSADSGSGTGNMTKIYGNGGTFKNLAVWVSANTRDGNSTITFRKNGVDQLLAVTILASTAGRFEDLINTVAVVANDTVRWQGNRGGTVGVVTIGPIAVDFETTDRTFLLSNFGTATIAAGAATLYRPLAGGNALSTTVEANAQSLGLTPFTLTNLKTIIASNGIIDASTLNVRKNGADGNLTLSITGLTNGDFEDVVNSDSVVHTDLLDVRFVAGATGTSLVIRTHQLTATVAAVNADQYLPMMGIGS